MLKNLLKYDSMLYCYCPKNEHRHILIIYNIYSELYKIKTSINLETESYIQKISINKNILRGNKDLKRNIEFNGRLDYLIYNS